MALITMVAGQRARAAHVNANFALCLLTDTARTCSVTHTWTASQTFTGGFTAAAAVTFSSTSLHTGVATFTAAPVFSSATASQALFTDGSKGLVSNAISGSGNVAMTTSAALTTPSIAGATLTGTMAGAPTWSSAQTFPGATLSAALTYGGVTLSNAVTGTGNMVLSASPTFTGTITAATQTLSGTLSVGSNVSGFGTIRLGNASYIAGKNAANNANISIVSVTVADKIGIDPDAVGTTFGAGVTIASGLTVSAGTTAVQALTCTTLTIANSMTNVAGDLDINSLTGGANAVRINRSGGTGGFIVYAGGTLTENFKVTDAGVVTCRAGITATTGTFTGLIQTTVTTEQMRLRYDASNYLSTTVSSTGDVTFTATGSVADDMTWAIGGSGSSMSLHHTGAIGGAVLTINGGLTLALGSGTGVVSVGAADSGGAGFKLLRVPN